MYSSYTHTYSFFTWYVLCILYEDTEAYILSHAMYWFLCFLYSMLCFFATCAWVLQRTWADLLLDWSYICDGIFYIYININCARSACTILMLAVWYYHTLPRDICVCTARGFFIIMLLYSCDADKLVNDLFILFRSLNIEVCITFRRLSFPLAITIQFNA
jgi:hypothetical protein